MANTKTSNPREQVLNSIIMDFHAISTMTVMLCRLKIFNIAAVSILQLLVPIANVLILPNSLFPANEDIPMRRDITEKPQGCVQMVVKK